MLIEVRVPTFKRPVLLKRAIASLIAQTASNWYAIIFDDSPQGEAESVIHQFADSRLIYRKNSKNLGCARSLDNAFKSSAHMRADFAFVLEDDNVLLPDFVKENCDLLKTTGCRILQRNQASWFQSADGEYHSMGCTTLDSNWAEGIVEPIQLAAMLLCHVPISNGGLFWRTDIDSDLVVGDSVKDGALQEFARSSQITEPIYCAMKPLAKYTVMNETTRGAVPYLQAAVFMQCLRRLLYATYGNALLDEAFKYAQFNPTANPRKWVAQDLGRYMGVRFLPYQLKGRLLPIRGKNPYPDYFLSRHALK